MLITSGHVKCGSCGGETQIFFDQAGGHWPSESDPDGRLLFYSVSTMRLFGQCRACVIPVRMLP